MLTVVIMEYGTTMFSFVDRGRTDGQQFLLGIQLPYSFTGELYRKMKFPWFISNWVQLKIYFDPNNFILSSIRESGEKI
jgi:hypothetical protein